MSTVTLFLRAPAGRGSAPSARHSALSGAQYRAVRSLRRPSQARPPDIRATLLHSPCRCRVDLEGAASRWASSQRSCSCCQSSEFIGRYRRPTAGAMALAESSCVRSGSAARATAVGAWCPRVPEERLERGLVARLGVTGLFTAFLTAADLSRERLGAVRPNFTETLLTYTCTDECFCEVCSHSSPSRSRDKSPAGLHLSLIHI